MIMMGLTGTAASLHEAADLIDEGEPRLAAIDLSAGTFGAGGAGRLGEFGRELRLRWQQAQESRLREAAAHAERVRRLAEVVARANAGLADADHSARDPQGEADGLAGPGVS
jgi:hypothetical protein